MPINFPLLLKHVIHKSLNEALEERSEKCRARIAKFSLSGNVEQ